MEKDFPVGSEEQAARSHRRSEVCSLSDVAAFAGVSSSTVSNVFRHPERVSAETIDQVRRAADDLGYAPNRAAQALRGRRSEVIGIGLVDLGSPFRRALIDAASARAWEHDLHVVVAQRSDDDRRWRDIEALFGGLGVLGTVRVDSRTLSAVEVGRDGAAVTVFEHGATLRARGAEAAGVRLGRAVVAMMLGGPLLLHAG